MTSGTGAIEMNVVTTKTAERLRFAVQVRRFPEPTNELILFGQSD